MKSIKNIALTSMLALASFGVVTMTSCNKDTTCDAGYEGSDCKTEVRAKFIHSYKATETGSSSGASTYNLDIKTTTTGVDKILITNMWGFFTNTVTATVSGNSFTIARQEPDADKYFVQGSGTLSGNTITVSYTVTNENASPIESDVVNGTWTVQ